MKADRFGQPILTSGAEGYASEKLLGLQARYKALPGFAEGIADAVKAGLSTLGDTIADRIAEKMPTFDDLTNSMDDFVAAIESITPGGKWNEEGSRVTSAETGEEYYVEVNSETGERRVKRHRPWYSGGIDDLIEDVSALPADVKDALNIGHASGLTFAGTGVYSGKFHGPEELLSQATTIKGPGIIDRALGALDGAVGSAGRATAGFSQAAPVTVNASVNADFNGARFASDIDIEEMLKKMEKRLIPACTTAIARQIGQGRT